MRITAKIAFMLLLCGATANSLKAQTESTSHVFPVIADGRFSDGSSFRSTFMISNSSSTLSANCTLRLRGMTADLVEANGRQIAATSTYSFVLNGNQWGITRTGGTQNFATGYASLSCSAPVTAHVLYSFYAASGVKLGEATVFSSLRGSILQLLTDQREGSMLGVAITNDSDSPVTYLVAAGDINGQSVGTNSLTIPARSTLLKFVSELVPAAGSNYIGQFLIGSNSGSVYAIGLRFTGGVFTTIPATVRAP